MIKAFEFHNLGPLEQVSGNGLGQINLIIGPNSAGKTWLLKALYAAIRTLEETGRGQSNNSLSDVLSDKLYWTFQTGKLGDIVSKGKNSTGKGKKLTASVQLRNQAELSFSFGQDTAKQVNDLSADKCERRQDNSIFLPPKEVLSLAKIILQTAVVEKQFGFDSTYTDLVLALQKQEPQGQASHTLAQAGHELEKMFDGRIEYDKKRQEWVYKVGNARYAINATAEGIKKIGILDVLIRNQYLSKNSVVFIDEPESALHPTAITQLLDVIHVLAKQGVQFFIASHSYYVVKKLFVIAQQENMNIPVLTPNGGGQWQQADLMDGIPGNEIINESIRLFEQEIGVV